MMYLDCSDFSERGLKHPEVCDLQPPFCAQTKPKVNQQLEVYKSSSASPEAAIFKPQPIFGEQRMNF